MKTDITRRITGFIPRPRAMLVPLALAALAACLPRPLFCLEAGKEQAKDASAPLAKLQTAVNSIIKILSSPGGREQKRKDIAEIYHGTFDLVGMAQMTLGSDWKGLSDEQKRAFAARYGDFVFYFYLGKLESYENNRVEYEGAEFIGQGDKALVRTLVEYQGAMAKMIYSMRNKKEEWRVYDVEIEGVRLSKQFQSQFQKLFKEKSFEAVMAELDSLIERHKNGAPETAQKNKESKNAQGADGGKEAPLPAPTAENSKTE